jgi:hypothetical protein
LPDQFSQDISPQHPPFMPQHAPPAPHPIFAAGDDAVFPFVIAPAPPLISRFTLPPHSGQMETG